LWLEAELTLFERRVRDRYPIGRWKPYRVIKPGRGQTAATIPSHDLLDDGCDHTLASDDSADAGVRMVRDIPVRGRSRTIGIDGSRTIGCIVLIEHFLGALGGAHGQLALPIVLGGTVSDQGFGQPYLRPKALLEAEAPFGEGLIPPRRERTVRFRLPRWRRASWASVRQQSLES
jgi:hypothetical protein